MTKLASIFNFTKKTARHLIPQKTVIEMYKCDETGNVEAIEITFKGHTYDITPDGSVRGYTKHPYNRKDKNLIREALAKTLTRRGIAFPTGFEFLEKDYIHGINRSKQSLLSARLN